MKNPLSKQTGKEITAMSVRWSDPSCPNALGTNFRDLNRQSALDSAMFHFELAAENYKNKDAEASDLCMEVSLSLIEKVFKTNKDAGLLLEETFTNFLKHNLDDAYTPEKDQQAIDALMYMVNEYDKENREELTLNNAEPRWLNQSGTYKSEALKQAYEKIKTIGREKLKFLSMVGLLRDTELNLDAELDNN